MNYRCIELYTRSPAPKKKSGMTVVETVIALAVIAIVSFTTIGFINRFTDVNAKMIYETDARLIAENALECFKHADSADEFAGVLSLSGKSFQRSDDVYSYSEYNFSVVVTAVYPPAGGRAVFSCRVADSGGKVIISVDSYSKEVSV